jgi:hypothetical protein
LYFYLSHQKADNINKLFDVTTFLAAGEISAMSPCQWLAEGWWLAIRAPEMVIPRPRVFVSFVHYLSALNDRVSNDFRIQPNYAQLF